MVTRKGYELKNFKRQKILLLPFIFSANLLILLLCVDFSSPQALKSFGESCDMDCDERQLLACSMNSSKCECMQPNSMFYDSEQQKCVGKALSPCVRYPPSDYRCIPHASCNKTSGLCECDKGYFETENSTACSLMSKHGEHCSAKKPCDRRSGMACLGSGRAKRTCQCMFPEDQYYDPNLNTCVSYAGGNCSFSLPCVRMAQCSVDIYERRQGENMHGKSYFYNVTVGRKCACIEGTSQTKSRQCLRSYREPCEVGREEPCNTEENLVCHDQSICLCANPLTQIYDEKIRKCVHLAGAKCKGGNDDDESVCVSNASCNDITGRCECNAGYSTTPYSTCLKDLGSECQGSSSQVGCNFYRGLHCSLNTCRCIDDQSLEYDSNSKTCVGREEMGCGTFLYDDTSGFLFGEEDAPFKSMMTMMGNHNREVSRGGGNAPSISNGNGVYRNQNIINGTSTSTSALSTTKAPNREKLSHHHHPHHLPHETKKIQIRCGKGLECVNEFSGETMKSGSDIFHGFCRKRQ